MDLRRGEGLQVLGGFLTIFGTVSSHTLLETARDALFLARIPASRLPITYLLIAVGAVGVGNLFTTLVSRLGRRAALVVWLLAGSTVSAVFWLMMSPARWWLFYLLYAWTGIFITSAMVGFWLLVSEVFTVGQGKRLFGLIGAGGSLGAVAGAAAAASIAARFPPENLLWVGAALLLLTSLLVLGARRVWVLDVGLPCRCRSVRNVIDIVAHSFAVQGIQRLASDLAMYQKITDVEIIHVALPCQLSVPFTDFSQGARMIADAYELTSQALAGHSPAALWLEHLRPAEQTAFAPSEHRHLPRSSPQ